MASSPSSPSILTFNLSVSNKRNIATINEPFQIMPTTQNYLTTKAINNYVECHNPGIILHMNYITKIFKKEAIEHGSNERLSLSRYATLAKKLGTKNILIHLPFSENELEHLGIGFKIMKDELIDKGITVHLEITAWCKSLLQSLKAQQYDPKEQVSNFITNVITYMNAFPPESFYIVFDTAHMFSNGCEVDDMIYIMNKFRDKIRYIHLNGNLNPKYTSDAHAPLFSSKSKITNWEKLAKYCASLGVICIAEVTKINAEWKDWERFAATNGFKLVGFNEMYSY